MQPGARRSASVVPAHPLRWWQETRKCGQQAGHSQDQAPSTAAPARLPREGGRGPPTWSERRGRRAAPFRDRPHGTGHTACASRPTAGSLQGAGCRGLRGSTPLLGWASLLPCPQREQSNICLTYLLTLTQNSFVPAGVPVQEAAQTGTTDLPSVSADDSGTGTHSPVTESSRARGKARADVDRKAISTQLATEQTGRLAVSSSLSPDRVPPV